MDAIREGETRNLEVIPGEKLYTQFVGSRSNINRYKSSLIERNLGNRLVDKRKLIRGGEAAVINSGNPLVAAMLNDRCEIIFIPECETRGYLADYLVQGFCTHK